MLQDGAGSADSIDGSHDAYRLTERAEIVRLLEEIQHGQKPVVLTLPDGTKAVSMLLEIDEPSGRFLYDVGRNQEETQAILSAVQVRFSAEIQGVSVRFTAPTPIQGIFAESPAFISPMPAHILYLQRRQYYRARIRLTRPYACLVRLADETEVSLRIQDLSLGGVRLQSSTISPEKLPIGTVLQNARLDFLELGKLDVAMRVISHRKTEHEGVPNYVYGCQFQRLPRGTDTAVQKLVFSLERLDSSNPSGTVPQSR